MKTDKELLDAARARNQEALAIIFDIYASALYKYAVRFGHDPIMADQIVGEVFSQLLEQFSSGRGPKTNLRAYLYQTTYHMIIDHGRASQRMVPLEFVDSLNDNHRSTSRRMEDQATLDLLLSAILNDLTDDQRHVIFLRYFEEFSLKETAVILGKTVNHIKVIQNRAMAKLRKSLGYSDDKREYFRFA